MINEHRVVINAALKTNDELGRLFETLGTVNAPRGRVLTAYRIARRALRGETGNLAVVIETMQALRQTVQETCATVLSEAIQIGNDQAERELKVYGLNAGIATGQINSTAATSAILATVDAQTARLKALALNGIDDEAVVLGDGERVGALAPGAVISEAAKWTGALAIAAWAASIGDATRNSGNEFSRQAIAAIDERTTDCCLRVNGQVVGLKQDFHLTGTPRFADDLRDPPFHWWCRTSVALIRASDADDDLTREMRAAARDELAARGPEGKSRAEIHPAHARSRR